MGQGYRAIRHVRGGCGNMIQTFWWLSRDRLAGCLVCGMIALSLSSGISGGRFPAWPAGVVAWVVGVLLLPSISRFQRTQVFVLVVLGMASLGYAANYGDQEWPIRLLVGNQALLAMLATVSFLRVVTDTEGSLPEVPPRGRGAVYQTLVTTHLFAAVTNISAAMIIGQRIARAGRLTSLQAKVVSRAFVSAASWSPLFASMAVALNYVPDMDILAVSRVNILLAFALLFFCAVDLRNDENVGEFVGYPFHREALRVPCVLSAFALLFYSLPTGWPVLTTIVVAALSSVLALLLWRPGSRPGTLLRQHVDGELPRMGGEFALFLGASVLSAGVGAMARVIDISLVVDPVRGVDGVPLLLALAGLTMIGVHPVISVATLAGLFPAELRRPDLVAMVILMAWSIALGASPFSGTALAMQGRFGIPATRFVRWNFSYLLAGLIFASVLLVAVDLFGWF
tara:strand:+ start:2651 stop:4015 length:1365 start_codon:yes stop_codon:yes gene_type:complete